MQLTEVSIFGLRSVVLVFKHRDSPLRFVLMPVVHMGRPDYYRLLSERLARCQLIVAEMYDGPSSTGLAYVTALRLTRQYRGGPLVHQNIDYEALGVPTVWPDGRILEGRRRRLPLAGWIDLALLVPYLTITMAVGGRDMLMRQNFEISDISEPRMRWALMNRLMLEERDRDLVATVQRIHTERRHEQIDVAVIYGAAHLPAVVRALAGGLGYRPQRGGEWLLAIDF
ncbi:hypothetical protein JIG36_13520 [Actinoplanes sp. LDG1-06]|uniref:Uncharacterized protein n=1 Tax=Paractinoplanes ovalisporus TaxID=2810368 RepID=A0ABS2A9S6_9ACTN|nr:hypothetical protein [Actinoplanes ovalisporus]MBM2616578.1 hypothetical protein [Actinoplanes ovalisporus]